MTITIQPELEQFVQQEIASGEYGDASAVVAEALRLLQQKRRHEALRDEIRIGVEQAERGETAPLDMNRIREEVHRRIETRAQHS